MQRLMLHIKLHAMHYMLPLILVMVLTAGGAGVVLSGIPVERIRWQALQWVITGAQGFAQILTKTTPSEKVQELAKLDGRRRKNGWKDTTEEVPWNHRMMEEGSDNLFSIDKWKIIPPKTYKKRHGGRMLKDIYVKMEFGVIGIIGLMLLFGHFFGAEFMRNVDKELLLMMTRGM